MFMFLDEILVRGGADSSDAALTKVRTDFSKNSSDHEYTQKKWNGLPKELPSLSAKKGHQSDTNMYDFNRVHFHTNVANRFINVQYFSKIRKFGLSSSFLSRITILLSK